MAEMATPMDGVGPMEELDKTPDTQDMTSRVAQSVNPSQATKCMHGQVISFC